MNPSLVLTNHSSNFLLYQNRQLFQCSYLAYLSSDDLVLPLKLNPICVAFRCTTPFYNFCKLYICGRRSQEPLKWLLRIWCVIFKSHLSSLCKFKVKYLLSKSFIFTCVKNVIPCFLAFWSTSGYFNPYLPFKLIILVTHFKASTTYSYPCWF